MGKKVLQNYKSGARNTGQMRGMDSVIEVRLAVVQEETLPNLTDTLTW